jgi:hypothetical protein
VGRNRHYSPTSNSKNEKNLEIENSIIGISTEERTEFLLENSTVVGLRGDNEGKD